MEATSLRHRSAWASNLALSFSMEDNDRCSLQLLAVFAKSARIVQHVRPSSHGARARPATVSSPVLRKRLMFASLAKALSQASRAEVDTEELKIIAIFCGAGLLLSLMSAMVFGFSLGGGTF